jgi:hypothetical protein
MTGLALSGCLGEDGSDPAGAGDGTDGGDTGNQTGTADGNSTTGASTTAPAPPAASFSILVDGNSSEPENGTHVVPLGADVTFDASGSQGDDLSFAWDLGDGNTSSGAEALYAYSATGNVTVTLTVTDSAGQTDEASADLRVESAGPAPGTPLTPVVEEFSGTILVGTQGDSGCGITGTVDVASHTFTIPAADEATGAAILVSKFLIEMSLGATALDIDMALVGPDGSTLGAGTDFNALSGPTETIEVDGEFAPGDYTIEVTGCTAVAGDYDITATADVVAA